MIVNHAQYHKMEHNQGLDRQITACFLLYTNSYP